MEPIQHPEPYPHLPQTRPADFQITVKLLMDVLKLRLQFGSKIRVVSCIGICYWVCDFMVSMTVYSQVCMYRQSPVKSPDIKTL